MNTNLSYSIVEAARLSDEIYDLTIPKTYVDEDIAVTRTMMVDHLGNPVQVYSCRGTTRDARDWWLDFTSIPQLDFELGWIAQGFGAGTNLIWPLIYRDIDPAIPAIFVGHSLGGVMAILLAAKAALRGLRIYHVCTFGAPRGGSRKLRTILRPYAIDQFRYGNDPVPRVPWVPFLYYHQRAWQKIGIPLLDPFSCHHMAGYYAEVKRLNPVVSSPNP